MKLRIIDGVEVHSSSGNVYADLGLADAEQLKIMTCWRRSNIDHLGVRLKTWTGLRHKSETLSVF